MRNCEELFENMLHLFVFAHRSRYDASGSMASGSMRDIFVEHLDFWQGSFVMSNGLLCSILLRFLTLQLATRKRLITSTVSVKLFDIPAKVIEQTLVHRRPALSSDVTGGGSQTRRAKVPNDAQCSFLYTACGQVVVLR